MVKHIQALCALLLLSMALGPVSAAAQAPAFSKDGVFAAMTRAGLPLRSKFAIIGVPYSDPLTSDNQRLAINDALNAHLPGDFDYLDRSQLLRIQGLIGIGDRLSDDIWANLQKDHPGLAGLIFYDPLELQDRQAVVTPRIILRNGPTLTFASLEVEVPDKEAAVRLEALVANFADRVAANSPKSEPLALVVLQDGITSPASSASDCRRLAAGHLAQALAAADARRYTGDAPRALMPEDRAQHVVRATLIPLDKQLYVTLEAASLGVFQTMVEVQPLRCRLAKRSWADTQGTLLERLLAWQDQHPGPLRIAVAEPPLIEGQHEDFQLVSTAPELWQVCAFFDDSDAGMIIPRPFQVGRSFKFPSQRPVHLTFPGGFAYDEESRSLITCVSGPERVIRDLAGPEQAFASVSPSQAGAWIDRAMSIELQVSSFEYFVEPKGQ